MIEAGTMKHPLFASVIFLFDHNHIASRLHLHAYTKCLQNLNFLCVFSEIYFVLLEFLALRMNGNFDGLADQRAAVPALHFTISRSHHICQRMSHNPCPIKCIILQLFRQRLFVPFFVTGCSKKISIHDAII